MNHILQLLAVPSKENGARAGAVANADNVALYNVRTVWSRCKGLVEAASAVGKVGNRVFMEAWSC